MMVEKIPIIEKRDILRTAQRSNDPYLKSMAKDVNHQQLLREIIMIIAFVLYILGVYLQFLVYAIIGIGILLILILIHNHRKGSWFEEMYVRMKARELELGLIIK